MASVRSSTPLGRYLALIYLIGAATLVVEYASAHWQVPSSVFSSLLTTSSLLFIAELCPIRIWRRGSINEYTLSGTFAIAMLSTGPLVYGLTAQLLALLIDEARNRKPLRVAAFNVAQYAIIFALSRYAFCLVTGAGFSNYSRTSILRDLVGLTAACLVFFMVNGILTGTVLGLADGKPVPAFALGYLREEFPVTPIVLGLAPVVVACMYYSSWVVPLTLLPILAVRRAAAAGADHEIASLHDALTGLPNRSFLLVRLGQSLREAAQKDERAALLILDLDHFKEINDTLGHPVGDELLRMVGTRLLEAVREEDMVARLGGDEFAVVMSGASEDVALATARRLARTLSAAFGLADVRLNVEASVGIAVYPMHGTDAESLIRCADVALFTAKRNRGSYSLYDPSLDEHTVQRLTLMSEFRRGIEQGELVVHYQPKVSMQSGQLRSVEALVRWLHPTRGLLLPSHFISAAENCGLIVPLTDHVINAALSAIRSWRADGLHVSVAVNVTARQISNLDLPTQLALALQSHDLPAEVLILEVTESCLMSDPGRARTVLEAMRLMGVRLSIDDFGTGYSSFAHLRDLPVSEIKIDRSFVVAVGKSAADAAIVKSTIELGHNLGLDVVAEGVDSQAGLDSLAAMGCDLAQGFYIAAPMPAEELLPWCVARANSGAHSSLLLKEG